MSQPSERDFAIAEAVRDECKRKWDDGAWAFDSIDLPTILASVASSEPVISGEKVNARLLAALKLAKDIFIANDFSLPRTFEVMNKAIAAVERQEQVCEWAHSYDEEEMPSTFVGSCHILWTFTEGDAIDNGVNYCQKCGQRVVVKEDQE